MRERAGGKGVNIARLLHQQGRSTLAAADVPTRLVELTHGETRRSVTVVADGNATSQRW